MKSPRLYQNTELGVDSDIKLDKPASHYLTRVLRLKDSSRLTIFNGDGYEYTARLLIQGKQHLLSVIEKNTSNNESNLNVTLLQGISKGDRMDICIQKSVELGVNKIIPVICQRTVVNLKQERSEKKLKHWQGIIISACEQSGRNIIPALTPPIHFKEALNLKLHGLSLTLDPTSSHNFNSFKPSDEHINLLIGPEGGLTQDEIILSQQHQFNGVCMGKRILRTETAAIAAVSALQTLWGDFTDS